jgi:hypothetical protein
MSKKLYAHVNANMYQAYASNAPSHCSMGYEIFVKITFLLKNELLLEYVQDVLVYIQADDQEGEEHKHTYLSPLYETNCCVMSCRDGTHFLVEVQKQKPTVAVCAWPRA